MMTWGILLVLALFMRFGPDIPFRRMLNQHVVERPIAFLMAHERHYLIFLVIAPVMLLMGGEIVLLLGPELMLAYAADVALYIDVVVIGAASASWTRTQTSLSRLQLRFLRARTGRRKSDGGSPRARRSQHRPSKPSAANDDDDGGRPDAGFALAA